VKYDNPDAVFRVSMRIEDHVEQMSDEVVCEFGWRADSGQAEIGWCAGGHVVDALRRLFTDDRKFKDALDAVIDCAKSRLEELADKRP
jgi:hypothetical protein